jgi:hypothetical protein
MSQLSLPHLTRAQAPLTCEIDTLNEYGEPQKVAIPAERALTVYVDKRELVTLMTLGAHPELLVLGYLRNQRLVRDMSDIASITVDWDVGAAAVKTRHGIANIEEKTAQRVVTTGCGQGSVFGGLMDEVDQIGMPTSRKASFTAWSTPSGSRRPPTSRPALYTLARCLPLAPGNRRCCCLWKTSAATMRLTPSRAGYPCKTILR